MGESVRQIATESKGQMQETALDGLRAGEICPLQQKKSVKKTNTSRYLQKITTQLEKVESERQKKDR